MIVTELSDMTAADWTELHRLVDKKTGEARPGAVFYEDEAVTLYRGDSLRVLSNMDDAAVDMVLTDPPYSSGGQFRSDRTVGTVDKYILKRGGKVRPEFAGDNRDQRGFTHWSALWLSEAARVSSPGALVGVFSDWRQLPATTDSVQAGGWIWRGIIPWDKTEAARPTKGYFRNQCEYLVWGSLGPLPKRADYPCLAGVYRQAIRASDKHHIAGKPTPLMEFLASACRRGGTVLDPFAGSGTTLIAAKKLGLRAIGVEMSDAYLRIAADRLAGTAPGLLRHMDKEVNPNKEEEGSMDG